MALDAPLVFEERGTNVMLHRDYTWGDVDRVFAAVDVEAGHGVSLLLDVGGGADRGRSTAVLVQARGVCTKSLQPAGGGAGG